MIDTASVHRHIDAHLDAHVARIRDFVRQPSVSLERTGLAECAALLARHLEAAGCDEAKIVDLGDGYPGVWACVRRGRPKTMLVYGHYDVRPVGAEKWTHPPFSAELQPFGGYPKAIIGRGVAAPKGPLQAFVNAVASMLAVEGGLPVDLVFLIEGAELLGSPNYHRLVDAHRDRLRGVSALYWPRAGQDASGTVGVNLGYKGLICVEFTASTAASGRGPQGGPVHSATAAIVDNPVWRLMHAMASMTDSSGREIAIPELRRAMAFEKPIEAWERPLLDAIRARAAGKDPNAFVPGLSPQTPVSEFRETLATPDLVQRYMYGPSFNVSGLRAGYTGPGTKSFLLPHEATATCDLRIVTDVPALEIVAMLRRHLDAKGFPDVRVDALGAHAGQQTPVDSPLVRAALATLERGGHATAIWPMQAYGGPWAHVAKQLGIPSLQGAAPGLGARVATSDEFLVVEGAGRIAGLAALEKHYVDFLHAWAAAD